MTEFYVYIVQCRDGSLYTGVAKDVEARVRQHNAGQGARYTRGRGPVVLIAQTGPLPPADALRLERTVKRAPRDGKRAALRAGRPMPGAVAE